MLAEALKRSLLEAEARGSVDGTPAMSMDLTNSPGPPSTPNSARSGSHLQRSTHQQMSSSTAFTVLMWVFLSCPPVDVAFIQGEHR